MDPLELRRLAIIHKSVREQVDFDKAFPQEVTVEEDFVLTCEQRRCAFEVCF